MKECVIIDGVRTANGRAHKDKGWFRNKRPDELLTSVYSGLFERNKQISPEEVEAVFIGSAAQVGMQNDIGRLAWLAGGFPENVAANTICQQCPSGMSAIEHAARAIMAGEGDIYIAGGVEDMLHVPMGMALDLPPRLAQRYNPNDIPMGPTAEKVAEQWNVSSEDMMQMAYYSHKNSAAARDAGKFGNEIIPVEGEKEDGTKFMVEHDQWIRDNISIDGMAGMKSPFKPDGVVTAALSSPLTAGACALILMSREKADELGLAYHLKYKAGAMAGCDPTIMGIGPIYAVKKLFERTGLTADDIDVVEINEAFASQSLASLRELGIEENAPFKRTNLWGGALALGHPLGESGARIVITLNNIMKTDMPEAKYGLATLCGGFGNANATLWEKV
ncbi:thiolase family protein [Metallumcola ferriviriculae]|uniref:acetyl-CoA C-acyltransferase n=1 Tax=Metallumcola ferriviriculae TaxID=3039180 RepID=A0AAU0UNN3_9FIRM|nr:thiolase family protein [Desulfitibacteraceae bacterium MK1]